MIKAFAVAASCFFVCVTGAFAGDAPLSVDAAKRFVASLESVKSLGEAREAEGKTKQLQFEMMPKAGEAFRPYSNSVAALKTQYPADYAKLRAAVKPHGFGAEEWGGVGDRVMVAYLARKMEKENPGAMAEMQSIDPSMLEMMPPEMKQQMLQAQAMMEAISAASPQDKKVVAQVEDDLEAYMNAEAAAQ